AGLLGAATLFRAISSSTPRERFILTLPVWVAPVTQSSTGHSSSSRNIVEEPPGRQAYHPGIIPVPDSANPARSRPAEPPNAGSESSERVDAPAGFQFKDLSDPRLLPE